MFVVTILEFKAFYRVFSMSCSRLGVISVINRIFKPLTYSSEVSSSFVIHIAKPLANKIKGKKYFEI